MRNCWLPSIQNIIGGAVEFTVDTSVGVNIVTQCNASIVPTIPFNLRERGAYVMKGEAHNRLLPSTGRVPLCLVGVAIFDGLSFQFSLSFSVGAPQVA